MQKANALTRYFVIEYKLYWKNYLQVVLFQCKMSIRILMSLEKFSCVLFQRAALGVS